MNNTSLGVIVMRVQVDDLHEGHYDIIKEVTDLHDKILIVIGLSPCKCTINNPLDYDTRRRMVLDHFPNAMVAYIEDVYSDHTWSEKLDTIIGNKSRNINEVILYGSRDSFISHYYGKFQTKSLNQRVHISGTRIRKDLALRSRDTKDFRAGAIWYSLNQYPTAIPTVDIAVIDYSGEDKYGERLILLGKKPGEDKYRLVGGFVQPGEEYEQAAHRELKEETGIEAHHLTPIKSFVIDDWRYRSETNKITTYLYVVGEWSGRLAPDDDIEELKWFVMDNEVVDEVVPHHRDMVKYLVESL